MRLVERGQAHQAVVAALTLEVAVGVLAAQRDRHALVASLFALGEVQDLGLILVALAPAQVHAHEHLGPVLGVDAAQADRDRHDRVRAVVRAIQAQLELELVDLFGELVLFALRLLQDRLVIFERGQLDQLQRVARTALDVQPRLELLPDVGKLTHELLGGGLIRPQVG